MDLNPSKFALLTGAGFTKDFGGFLASEMHERILNHRRIDEIPRVRELLLDDFDYESVYSKILNDIQSSEQEKQVLLEILVDVLVLLDDYTKDYCHNERESRGVAWGGVHAILHVCNAVSNKKGYHFTTNQDIFLERQTGRRSGFVPCIGGNQAGLRPRQQLQSSHYISLPNAEEIERLKQQFNSSGDLQYIKLHGSLGWISANGGSTMVVGKAKLIEIEKEPILQLYYHEIFKPVVFQGGCHLLVVGYSFGDKHINDAIVEAAREHDLKLFVITPSGPEVLKQNLERVDPILWKKCKYIKGGIKELSPYGQDHRTFEGYLFRTVGIK